jgi:hypothetical protein
MTSSLKIPSCLSVQELYGYQVLTMLTLVTAYIVSLRLVFLERNNALPSIPTRGHGLLLLVFWALALVRENIAFVSWWSKDWWWRLNSYVDFFCFFCCCKCCFCFT